MITAFFKEGDTFHYTRDVLSVEALRAAMRGAVQPGTGGGAESFHQQLDRRRRQRQVTRVRGDELLHEAVHERPERARLDAAACEGTPILRLIRSQVMILSLLLRSLILSLYAAKIPLTGHVVQRPRPQLQRRLRSEAEEGEEGRPVRLVGDGEGVDHGDVPGRILL